MRKPFNFGSVLMMLVTALVAVGIVYVLPKLSSGKMPDFSAFRNPDVVLFSDEVPDLTVNDVNGKTNTVEPQATAASKATPTVTPVSGSRLLTLNLGGTVSIGDKIRKSAYASDAKVYDFTEIMKLLKPYLDGDLNIAFLENLCLDSVQVSSLVLPYQAPEMLSEAGFDTVFTGFSKLADKGEFCVSEHLDAISRKGLKSFGAWKTEPSPEDQIVTAGGVRVALLQYTQSLTSAGSKVVKKTGNRWVVPTADPEAIASDIRNVREAGAEVVLVGLSWGKADAAKPTEAQKELARRIAEAGADLIIGSGSQVVQTAETLKTSDGREVFCAYSIGSLINPNREKFTRMSGLLLRLTVECDPEGKINLCEASYLPTYTWYYRMDGINYYRTLAADRDLPDGIGSDQQKNCTKAAAQVAKALDGTLIELQ